MIRSITRLFSRIGTSLSEAVKKIRITPNKPKLDLEPTETIENIYSAASNTDIPHSDKVDKDKKN